MSLFQVSQGLYRLLRLSVVLGLTIVLLGYSYSHLLLQLLSGDSLTSRVGPSILRAEFLLVFFMMINLTTECFTTAIMTQAGLDSYNRRLLAISVVFVGLAWLLTGLLGPVGFVLANCCNMAMRTAHSAAVIYKTFQGREQSPLQGLNPGTVYSAL